VPVHFLPPLDFPAAKSKTKIVTKSRLRMALAAEKGIDYKKLKQQKKHKEHLKRKNSTSQLGGAPLHGDENDENEDKGQNRLNDDLEEEVKNDDEVEDERVSSQLLYMNVCL
jgi:rRNA-processing protein EBP2